MLEMTCTSFLKINILEGLKSSESHQVRNEIFCNHFKNINMRRGAEMFREQPSLKWHFCNDLKKQKQKKNNITWGAKKFRSKLAKNYISFNH